ncbi:ribonuclease Y [bacterium]|nr:ribonuclease Y [bacterium]
MTSIILLIIGVVSLSIGSILGYYTRQSIAKKRAGTLEAKLQKKIEETKKEAKKILDDAQAKASQVLEKIKKEEELRRKELLRVEKIVLKRENILNQRLIDLEREEKKVQRKVKELREVEENLKNLKDEAIKKLESISGLSREEAKKELLENLEKEYQKDILERLRKIEKEGKEKLEERAKKIIAFAIQRYALPQSQEITTTTVSLPSDDIKGRIIGKEGRNIRTLEKLTGTELIVDDTPETVIISGFDPVRRHIAKIALEKLIQDGRIQPARIEKIVKETKEDIATQIQEAGEQALYEVGLVGVHPKLVQLLGRLRFRTSYGQNVLLHSIEVAHLAAALAAELGANVQVAKKAGLFHDIGKAVDHQVQGSHVEIGMRILEKFGIEKEVIDAMKSHHEEYPAESIEAVLVQAADQISGARPGARKDNIENYLKRLEDLENIATSFPGVEKAYAIQAGRELRVFVRPEEIDDLTAHQLAREIANKIEKELRYPGEIKVNLIRESRVVEYAK